LRVREVANILGVSRYTVYKWVKEGRLSAVFLPSGRIRIPESQIIALIKKEEGGEGGDGKN